MTDWQRFVAMMGAAGWLLTLVHGQFLHLATGAGYHVDGHYCMIGAKAWKRDSVEPWTAWLAAGETPPPF